MKELPIKEAVCTRSGQMGPYSDRVTSYEVHTENGQEIDKEDLLPYCFNLCHRSKIQSWEEWKAGYGDPGKYFAGYYTLTRTSYGYHFSFTQPFTD